MNDDLRLVKIHETRNQATIAIIKSVLDGAEIKYMIPGEYDHERRYMEVLVNEQDAAAVRELLSELLKDDEQTDD